MPKKKNKSIAPYQSHKLEVCSLILMILVVFLHSNLLQYETTGINEDFQLFISRGIAIISVPLFFCFSAFLFFYSPNKPFNLSFYVDKLKRRAKTLLIPYILWRIIGLLIIGALSYIAATYGIEALSDKDAPSSINSILENIFYQSQYTYPLWFLRDLMILVLCAPLVYFIINITKEWFVIFFIIYGIFPMPIGFLGSDPIFFYLLGAYLAIVKPNFLYYKLPKLWMGILTLTFLLGTVISLFIIEVPAYVSLGLRIMGCALIWFGYDFLPSLQNFHKEAIIGSSFFIYLAHEPLLTIIKKSGLFLFGNGQLSLFMIFCLAPIITICLCIIARNILYRYLPSVYNILTGAR